MFCILLANLRKRVKIPYNLLSVNEHFEGKPDAERALLDSFYFISRATMMAAQHRSYQNHPNAQQHNQA